MKAIILCAGYGTRLYPLTKDTQKSLIKVAGKPIIEHIILRIEEIKDMEEIIVVTNDRFYNDFLKWHQDYKPVMNIKIVNDMTKSNEERLGAIGDIHFVVSKENINEDVLIIAGDNLFDFSLNHLVSFFHRKKASAIALFDIKDSSKSAKKYGVVEIDNEHRIIDFHEKPEVPKTSLVSTACYLLSKADIMELELCLKTNKKLDNLGEFIKYLSNKKRVYGYVFSERWFDIGSHEHLKNAEEYWKGR